MAKRTRAKGRRKSESTLGALLPEIVGFEAAASVAKTGAGARKEGRKFEELLVPFWKTLAEQLAGKDSPIEFVRLGSRSTPRTWGRVRVGARSVLLPAPYPVHDQVIDLARHPQMQELAGWLQTEFEVAELVESYPGENTAVRHYAPAAGQFAGDSYPEIYEGMTTKFDGTIILEEKGALVEKILLEYKTAKSSKGTRLDGNAHERLSFQMMQYLEIAQRFTRCSLAIFANDAFVRYKNKYHVNFRVQIDRLADAFDWFHVDYLVTDRGYLAFFESIRTWLTTGRGRLR